MNEPPLITNDAVVLGLLAATLGFVFYTSRSNRKFWMKFYTYFPPLLMCYFIPALFNSPFGVISGKDSALYTVAKEYFLPASLILLCLSIDIKSIVQLGPKALIMFFAASTGVMLGGPLALWVTKLCFPSIIAEHGDMLWRGLSTIAGSWIGGAPNQAAMKEIYAVDENVFGTMVVIDVIVSYLWMAVLLACVPHTKTIDRWLKGDVSEIEKIKAKTIQFRTSIEKIPETYDLVLLFAIAFAGVGLSHLLADGLSHFFEQHETSLKALKLQSLSSRFLWLVIIATTLGLLMSMTSLRRLEGSGASKWGTLFIYFLVTTIGMQMNLEAVMGKVSLLVIGLLWMLFHILFIVTVAKVIRAPFFFLAVGSQANIGGPASAPVVAAAFSPALAPLGIILAVMGYAVGTYGAIMCASLMAWVTG